MRYVGYAISGLLLSLGFLWVVFDSKRQGLHDKLASSYVVYDETRFSSVDEVEFLPTDPRQGWGWLVFGLCWLYLRHSLCLVVSGYWDLPPADCWRIYYLVYAEG